MKQHHEHNRALESLINDQSSLKRLAQSDESRRLCQLLDEQANGALKNIAEQALAGDSRPLYELLQATLRTEEGAALAGKIGTGGR